MKKTSQRFFLFHSYLILHHFQMTHTFESFFQSGDFCRLVLLLHNSVMNFYPVGPSKDSISVIGADTIYWIYTVHNFYLISKPPCCYIKFSCLFIFKHLNHLPQTLYKSTYATVDFSPCAYTWHMLDECICVHSWLYDEFWYEVSCGFIASSCLHVAHAWCDVSVCIPDSIKL